MKRPRDPPRRADVDQPVVLPDLRDDRPAPIATAADGLPPWCGPGAQVQLDAVRRRSTPPPRRPCRPSPAPGNGRFLLRRTGVSMAAMGYPESMQAASQGERDGGRRIPFIQDSRIYDSAVDLSTAYGVLDRSDVDPVIADLAERETANSLGVANAIFGDANDSYFSAQSLTDTKVVGLLSRYNTELCDRWSGAIFALSPENLDAARHFCGSSREIVADKKHPRTFLASGSAVLAGACVPHRPPAVAVIHRRGCQTSSREPVPDAGVTVVSGGSPAVRGRAVHPIMHPPTCAGNSSFPPIFGLDPLAYAFLIPSFGRHLGIASAILRPVRRAHRYDPTRR